MNTSPQPFEILLVPTHVEKPGEPHRSGDPVRSAVVEPTGETGASGYPRYEGGGMLADIDPASGTVEALLVDGAELDYGLTAVAKPRN
ncbi:hypothetical protein ACIA6C_12265 [Streptomyces sp. NPDC051578]|uniref:hypothetical protein n=1 Tax=unclassified Streptomyces TaxID=2593676 RepID=UPI00340D06BE